MAYKRNQYDFIDDSVVLYVKRRNGDMFEIYADKEDFELLKNYCWHVGWHEDIQGFYAEAMQYLGKVNGKFRSKTLLMHKLIMNAPKKTEVDHIDHDGLNNRKSNLRISEKSQNKKHRSGRNSNNTSGYRNVSWDGSKWMVQLQINKRNTVLGKFEDLEEAAKFAEEKRKELYGEFAGNE